MGKVNHKHYDDDDDSNDSRDCFLSGDLPRVQQHVSPELGHNARANLKF